MELPKNITQIGETDPHCKIYVEDYVISYIKQLNAYAKDKSLAVGLYGTRKEEDGVTYLFFYGACRLELLQKECRHLSQAVQQEAERQRKRFFPEHTFLGYRLLDGELVEDFYVCEQNVCRIVEGYAQFYEKNDRMLAFMLEERQQEAKPEAFDQEKYDVVKKRQEERKALAESKKTHIPKPEKRQREADTTQAGGKRLQNMRLTAAVSFALLGVVGLTAMGAGQGLGELRTTVRQLVEEMTRQQLPDAAEVSNGSVQVGTIVTEDKLTDAILKENAEAGIGGTPQPVGEGDSQPDGGETASPDQVLTATEEPATPPPVTPEPTTPEPATPEPEPVQQEEPTEAPTPAPTEAPAPEPVSYTIRRGDTLIGICMKKYGSDERVAEICALNQISNPDDIKEGETILLP